jgi:ubiquinone/menaquinone biosynthesis C-methylase UbiE
VLDLGAGTGKLTRDLLPTGAEVVAVEPLDEMRAQLLSAVPGVRALKGTAEQIPLPDASVDAVLSAQAFHWFRAKEALPEIHRVLRPGRGLGLIWNSRDLDDPVQAVVEEALATVRGRSAQYWEENSNESVEASPLFGEVEHRIFRSRREMPLEGVVDEAASRSYVASLDDARRIELLDELRAALADEPEPIVLRYIVDVYVADRR